MSCLFNALQMSLALENWNFGCVEEVFGCCVQEDNNHAVHVRRNAIVCPKSELA